MGQIGLALGDVVDIEEHRPRDVMALEFLAGVGALSGKIVIASILLFFQFMLLLQFVFLLLLSLLFYVGIA